MSVLTDNQFWRIFANHTVTTPVYEIMLVLVVIAVCLLARWPRAGLLLTFVYVYRWGWLFMHEQFGAQPQVLIGYYVVGVFVMVCSVIAFMMNRE